ncbi:hypothetical protein KC336_g11817 [Hortaea werneckii]|nr:hypothetical protein KC336_g11817 [Hortaea werneckii]
MAYGTKFNLTTLTSAMDYQNWSAQLMSAPPYVAGAIESPYSPKYLTKYTGKHSHRSMSTEHHTELKSRRMPFVVGPFSLCVIGFAVVLGLQGKFADSVGGAYSP